MDTDIPTFNCYLLDLADPAFMMTHGMGTDMDPVTAVVRAMTEAAQSRAVFRSGERDFAFSEEIESFRTKRSDIYKSISDKISASVNMSDIKQVLIEDYEEIVNISLEKLKKAGLEQVLVFPLTREEHDIIVVRVLIPGMEGQLFSSSLPGARAAKYFNGEKK